MKEDCTGTQFRINYIPTSNLYNLKNYIICIIEIILLVFLVGIKYLETFFLNYTKT